jgi:hypothetical protein
MTLLLSLANDSYSIVLGDRRLSRNGVVCEDESNKVCVLFCNDARVAIAYTGVAQYGKFRTQDWLRDTLYDASKNVNTLEEILAEFQSRATSSFAKFPVAQRQVAFLMCGYRYLPGGGANRICHLLSNVEPTTAPAVAKRTLEFYELGTPGSVIVEGAGFKSVLTEKDYADLHMILSSPATPPYVLHKAVEIVQRVSKEPCSKRMIGSQCNSAVVPRRTLSLPAPIIPLEQHLWYTDPTWSLQCRVAAVPLLEWQWAAREYSAPGR